MTSLNSISIELEKIKKKFFLERIQEELNSIETGSDRHIYLTDILQQIPLDECDLTKTLDLMYQNSYKKPWSRLPMHHKILKLREYLDEKNIVGQERSQLNEIIKTKLADNTLNTCKFVSYDITTCKITKLIIDKQCV